jgi:hypothetical protein
MVMLIAVHALWVGIYLAAAFQSATIGNEAGYVVMIEGKQEWRAERGAAKRKLVAGEALLPGDVLVPEPPGASGGLLAVLYSDGKVTKFQGGGTIPGTKATTVSWAARWQSLRRRLSNPTSLVPALVRGDAMLRDTAVAAAPAPSWRRVFPTLVDGDYQVSLTQLSLDATPLKAPARLRVRIDQTGGKPATELTPGLWRVTVVPSVAPPESAWVLVSASVESIRAYEALVRDLGSDAETDAALHSAHVALQRAALLELAERERR